MSICGLLVFHQRTYKLYLNEIQTLSQKEYKLWRYIGVGLFLLDHLPIEKLLKPNYPILELFGKQQYSRRVRLFEAERITLFILLVFVALLVALMIGLKSFSLSDVQVLERAPYGEEDQTVHYSYELNMEKVKTNERITIVIPQQSPNQIEKEKALEEFLEDLPQLILNGNESLQHVTKQLNLFQKYKGGDITLSWESQNDRLLLSSGEIRYNNLPLVGEKVEVKGSILFYGLKKDVCYEVTLFQKPLSEDGKREQVIQRIKSQFSRENLVKISQNKITLPEELEEYGAKLKWYAGEKTVSISTILLGGLFSAAGFYWLKTVELKSQVKKREEELLREFPGCINKFTLLMNAGMTFSRAWEKITSDYIQLRQMEGEVSILYEEMLMTLEDIKKGMSEYKAYEAFSQRCKIPEILRFTSLIIQNIKKGSHLLIGALHQQSKEALCIRQDLARKKGEKASTKLIFPMGIMFMAILIIVITPAIISLKL